MCNLESVNSLMDELVVNILPVAVFANSTIPFHLLCLYLSYSTLRDLCFCPSMLNLLHPPSFFAAIYILGVSQMRGNILSWGREVTVFLPCSLFLWTIALLDSMVPFQGSSSWFWQHHFPPLLAAGILGCQCPVLN